MTYAQFVEKNKANEKNFKKAVKAGQINPAQLNPYVSSSIEKVDMNRGDGYAEISSKLRNDYTNTPIAGIVYDIMARDYIHVTNPSKIKSWSGFKYE